ncbi:MAG: hypothetical protein IJV76_02460 [Clostridia bacterium]|nr:hypothetical protein [Clostridia bacterium]
MGKPTAVMPQGGSFLLYENKDAYEGRAWQEFYLPDCVAAYRRCALDADTWSEWSYGSDVVLAQNSRTIDDPVTKFPKGMRTKVYLTQGTETTALPGDYGWLTTDRINLNEQVQHQTFRSRSTGNLAGNVYYRVWNGSAWDPWTALGERTASMWGRNQAWFTKTVGTSVFDKTLGKPLWWNGSAWVDAAGTVV